MPLVKRTPIALEIDHRDFTNRVGRGLVCDLAERSRWGEFQHAGHGGDGDHNGDVYRQPTGWRRLGRLGQSPLDHAGHRGEIWLQPYLSGIAWRDERGLGDAKRSLSTRRQDFSPGADLPGLAPQAVSPHRMKTQEART